MRSRLPRRKTDDDRVERCMVHAGRDGRIDPARYDRLIAEGWQLARTVRPGWAGSDRGLNYFFERRRS